MTHGSKIDRAVAGAESSDDADKKDESIYSITRSESNVMCCFSDDDRYFLVSGVDNSVSQYHTIDGSLSIQYQVGPSGRFSA